MAHDVRMSLRIRIVDAFTDHAFGGNPAAVAILDGDWPDPQWMHQVALELSLPMTAFVRRPAPAGEGTWGLRWFGLTGEHDYCGHATLATAQILYDDGLAAGTVRFDTLKGVLTAQPGAEPGTVSLDLPATTVTPREAPAGLGAALGAEPEEAHATGSLNDVLLVFASGDTVRTLHPDLPRVGAVLRAAGLRGVITTARADAAAAYDFVSRWFAPHNGFDEDQVTGSAHTALAPFWSSRLGRTRLTGYQASPRGGTVRTELSGDRVLLTGRAVTVLDGTLQAAAQPVSV